MALSFDPQSLPVLRVDDHLPAISADAMTPEALRRRFARPPAWSPEIVSEHRLSPGEPANASVLIAMVDGAMLGGVGGDGLGVLLTQRTDHLTHHPGQISFPGGRVEAADVDSVATALREAREEIGLDPTFVEVLGTLPSYATGTSFIVTPVVALVKPGYELLADPFEVAEVFVVPLDFLMNPAHHRHHAIEVGGVMRSFLSMPWTARDPDRPPYFVWGATAAMLRNLYRFLQA